MNADAETPFDPRRAAAMVMPFGPLAVAAMDSGTLPGEEQVTTMDTLKSLSPPEQAAIKKRYDASAWPKDTPYEDFVGELFSEIPPGERAAAMRKYASQAPRIYVGRDPNAIPGKNTALANARNDAGKPLPEGRNADQYTEDQRRTMQRNVFAPERPTTPFGGTFTYRPNGSRSMRAPNPEYLALAQQIANDPTQGAGSASHVAALAQAYGLDVQRYGNDMDLLASDTAAEQAIHEPLMARHDIVPNEMGGFRYAPNRDKFASARAAEEAQATPERKSEFATTIMQRYQRVLTPEDIAALNSYVSEPDGFSKMRQMAMTLSRLKALRIASNVADRAANRNITNDMNNPALARGLAIRSLMAQVQGNNPLGMAAVYSAYGDPEAAHNAMQLAAVDRTTAAHVAAAQAAANAGQAPSPLIDDGPLAEQLKPQIDAALLLPPTQRNQLLGKIYRSMGVPEAEVPEAIRNTVLDHEALHDPNSPTVMAHLLSLRHNEAAFKDFIIRRMRRPPEEADARWRQLNPPYDARQAGRNAVNNVTSAVSAVTDAARGFGEGVGEAIYGP